MVNDDVAGCAKRPLQGCCRKAAGLQGKTFVAQDCVCEGNGEAGEGGGGAKLDEGQLS